MTLRQKLVIKDITESIKNPSNKTLVISKIMRKNGYKESSCNTESTRKFIQEYTKKIDFFSPEKIKKDIGITFKMAKREKDITNMSRINEHRSKIAGMIVDKAENKNINIEEEKKTIRQGVIDYMNNNKPSSEN